MDFRYMSTVAKKGQRFSNDDKLTSGYRFNDENRVLLAKALELDELRTKKIGYSRKCNKNGI